MQISLPTRSRNRTYSEMVGERLKLLNAHSGERIKSVLGQVNHYWPKIYASPA